MKSLLELPSKEFVNFLTNEVKDWQQTHRLGCTFWWKDIACFCNVYVMPTFVETVIRPIDMAQDIGNGCGSAVEKQFKRNDEPKENKVVERLAARFKIIDNNGDEMPRHPSGRLRTWEEAIAMQERLNKGGEYKPYLVIEDI